MRVFAPGELAELADMVLLVPLHMGPEQVGALLLGTRPGSAAYSAAEQAVLEMLADPLAALLHTAQLQEAQSHLLNQTLDEFRRRERTLEQQQQALLAPPLSGPVTGLIQLGEREMVALVEKALRRLHDFGYLGELPLAGLQVVQQQIDSQAESTPPFVVTPVDRGKVLVQVLGQAMDKLRPDAKPPTAHEVPGREWYPYLILHHSYVLEEPTRDLMGWLYISEGTYNRTRRDALRSLAKTLLAMEQAALQRT
jgi:hypothetical protein